jgi:serine/threonine protein kinase
MGQANSAPVNPNNPEDMMRAQMLREATILVGDATCRVELEQDSHEKNMQILLDNINQFKVKEKLKYDYYDPTFMYLLGCVLKVGLTVDNRLSAGEYVKDFLTDQKQIGGISVEGVAMMVGEKGLKDMFVVKAPRDPRNDNLIHEYFVAAGGTLMSLNGSPMTVVGTNWLRKFCLNYAQILGAFRCGPPDLDPLSKRLRNWCNPQNSGYFVNYVIYEKIDGPDLRKLESTITPTEYVTSMIQLALALEIAQLYNGFTHYDLHDENVIMRETENNEEVLIPFVVADNLTYYVESSHILTIIDFGRAHIQSPSRAAELRGQPAEHFGFHSRLSAYGIRANSPRPYYDLYKLLGFSLNNMRSVNPATYEQVWPLMGFFGLRTREAVDQWLNENIKLYYSLTDDIEKVGFCLTKEVDHSVRCLPEHAATMYDFLQYVEAQFPAIWQAKVFNYPISGKKVLKCGAECGTAVTEVDELETPDAIERRKLSSLGDLRNFIRFRNNLDHRAAYFTEKFPQSQHGPKLRSEVQRLDEQIRQIYPNVIESYIGTVYDKATDVGEAYINIGYPIVYAETFANLQEVINELQMLDGALNRMGDFAKAYAEYKEFFEAAEDMALITGNPLDEQLRIFNEAEVTPLYQSFDQSRGELREYIRELSTPKNYEEYKEMILAKTL